jgi:hypothetical protein
MGTIIIILAVLWIWIIYESLHQLMTNRLEIFHPNQNQVVHIQI